MTFRVSDYFPENSGSQVFDSARVEDIKTLFDKEITIREVRFLPSGRKIDNPWVNMFGEAKFVVFEFFYKGCTYNTHTGAKEICSKLQELKNLQAFPVTGKVVLRDNGSYGLI